VGYSEQEASAMSDLDERYCLEPPDLPPEQLRRDPAPRDSNEPEAQERSGRSTERKLLIAVSILLIFVSLAFLIRNQFLTIRNLKVTGISRVPWQQVALSAGLNGPVPYFSLDEARIRDGINANRYLAYVGLEKVFPSTLILHVRERQPVACVHYIGVAYLMAADGMILERTRNLAEAEPYMTVSGLQVRDIRVGAIPVCTRAQQFPAYLKLMEELMMQGYAGMVSNINLAEPQSIHLTTRDGYTVHLGDDTSLRAKIGTVRGVIDDLKRRGFAGGLIEATVPGEATFRPESM
jgi:cell division septal protein FtsQ